MNEASAVHVAVTRAQVVHGTGGNVARIDVAETHALHQSSPLGSGSDRTFVKLSKCFASAFRG